MPLIGFEPTNTEFERVKILRALDRAAIHISHKLNYLEHMHSFLPLSTLITLCLAILCRSVIII
jgi:hypothetical protein